VDLCGLTFAYRGLFDSWLAHIDRANSGQSFGLTFVGNASLNERVETGMGTFHRIPLALLTNSGPASWFSVEAHSIDDP